MTTLLVEVAPAHTLNIDPARVRDAGRALAAEADRFSGYGWMRGTAGNSGSRSSTTERLPAVPRIQP